MDMIKIWANMMISLLSLKPGLKNLCLMNLFLLKVLKFTELIGLAKEVGLPHM